MLRKWWTWIALLGVATAPQTATANPWSILGFDGDSIGKGGALTGGAAGVPAIYYNPAGIIKAKQRDIRVSYIHGEPLLKYDVDDNPDLLDLSGNERIAASELDGLCGGSETCLDQIERYNNYLDGADNIRQAHLRLSQHAESAAKNPQRVDGMTVGMVMPLAIDPSEAWAAAGAAIYLPFGPIIRQRLKGPSTPFFLKYDDAPHRIVVDAGAAVEVFDSLRFGAGVDALVDVVADPSLRIIMPPEMEVGGIPPDPNFGDIQVFVDGEVALPPVFAPTAGIQYSPTDWVDIGFSFRDEQSVKVELETTVLLESPFGTQRIPASVVAGGVFTPRQLAGGFAFHPLQGFSVFADVTWKQWSKYVPPFAIEAEVTGVGDAACDVVRSFHDLDNLLQIVEDLGLTDELDSQTICDLIEDIDLNNITIDTYDQSDPGNAFRNTFSPALGLHYGPDAWGVSGGYRFDPSPVPTQDGVSNILDADTHILSGAFDYQVMSFVTVGLYGQYRMLSEMHTSKSTARSRSEISSDAFPDASFSNVGDPRTDALADTVAGQQLVVPGQPGYTVGGGYLSGGIHAIVNF